MSILKYWLKLLTTDNCILKSVYDFMYDNIDTHVSWLSEVKRLLFSIGLGYIWLSQYVEDKKLLLNQCKTQLTDPFIREMYSYYLFGKCTVIINIA